MEWFDSLVDGGDIVVMKVWSFGSCMMRNVNCGFGLTKPDLKKKLLVVGFTSLRPVGSGKTTHACFSARALCGPASRVYWKTLSKIKQDNMLQLQRMTRSA